MSEPAERLGSEAKLPFAFARRHGLLVRGLQAGVVDCVYRMPASAEVAHAEIMVALETAK